VNPKLDDQPELVNKDPYGEGWIVKVTIEDEADLDDLLSSEAYKAFIGQ
jgi:glycine cleavage system H protein